MAMLGFGTTIEFDSGFEADVTNVKHSGMKREKIDTTHMLTGIEDGADPWMTSVPAEQVDPGDLELEIFHALSATPPIFNDPEPVTVTFTDGTSETNENSYMTDYEWEAVIDGVVKATVKVALSGLVEFA